MDVLVGVSLMIGMIISALVVIVLLAIIFSPEEMAPWEIEEDKEN